MAVIQAPLRGKDGIYRIVIHGNSGVGKTTLSNQLSELLQIPVIHLDEIHWRPGWVEAPNEEMVKDLTAKIDQAARNNSGWVIDGNYESCVGRVTDYSATDIICLSNEPILLGLGFHSD